LLAGLDKNWRRNLSKKKSVKKKKDERTSPKRLDAEGNGVDGAAKLRRSPQGGGHSRNRPPRCPRRESACAQKTAKTQAC
jgi:hypothetical protein